MLILASQSQTRLAMLRNVGLSVASLPAYIDEDAVKQALWQEKASVERAAETLAELKAQKVAAQVAQQVPQDISRQEHESVFVIGADQMLVCGSIWFDKPPDMMHAKAQLQSLSGKMHQLVSSVVLFKDGERIWHYTDKVNMDMRVLSEDFVDAYLAEAGEAVLSSVGSYQLEGLGAQLFRQVSGDYFSVLGLPLLPLLDMLRNHGVMKI